MKLKENQKKGSKSSRNVAKNSSKAAVKTNCTATSDDHKFAGPSPDEVSTVVYLLGQLHGVPVKSEERMSVLDSLIRTILSQNTTDKTSKVAFDTLKLRMPTWKQVMETENSEIEDAIRFGGLAEIKTNRIKAILSRILEEYAEFCPKGEPSLEWMREIQDDESIKRILSSFKGVGPKTVACVLMFNLHRAEFPVDTHVLHITKKLNWCPQRLNREEAYEHLNATIPDHLKYALHVLLESQHRRVRREYFEVGMMSLPY